MGYLEWVDQRRIDVGTKVRVHFHLRKKVFVIVPLEGEFKNKTVLYTDNLSLENVEFRVRESGRQRVLRERQKNIHAFAVGRLQNFAKEHSLNQSGAYVNYNPYNNNSFVVEGTDIPVKSADSAKLFGKSILAYQIN